MANHNHGGAKGHGAAEGPGDGGASGGGASGGRADRVLLAHGDGGLLTANLVEEVFLPYLGGQRSEQLLDAAVIQPKGSGRLALTTDSFVVKPVFFPGGDIGSLAVHGTVTDLAAGARPVAITAGFILEEGLDVDSLVAVVRSMGEAAARAGVHVVAGDTKVVERGAADQLFINTTGLGEVLPQADLAFARIAPGDRVLVTGTVGDHGVAVLSRRRGLAFDTPVRSDSAPLFDLVAPVLEEVPGVKFLRDPTRGGLATTLKEIALSAGVEIVINEERIPMDDAVRGACDILGLDPLYLANEGKMILVVAPGDVAPTLQRLRRHPLGATAAEIGVVEARAGQGELWLRTTLGGTKRLDRLAGEQLPRIC
ncbi:MAG: hydrogenase expression/formation protein HypE [Bacillota bacterium]